MIKKLKQGTPKKYDWGISYPVNSAEETKGVFCSFYKIITRVGQPTTSKPEYHKKSWENHLILKGRGKMLVGDKMVKVFKGVSIVLPPNMLHQVFPETQMEVYVIAIPPVSKEDIFEA